MIDRSGERCPQCGGSMAGRNRRAKYCGRQCQLDAYRGRPGYGQAPSTATEHRHVLYLTDAEERALHLYGPGRTVDEALVEIVERAVTDLAASDGSGSSTGDEATARLAQALDATLDVLHHASALIEPGAFADLVDATYNAGKAAVAAARAGSAE